MSQHASAHLTCSLLKRKFLPKMKEVLETEEQINHSDIVNHIKNGINDERILHDIPTANTASIIAELTSGDFKHVWPPVTTSGCLKEDIIFIYIESTIGEDKACIGRTYGVDPTKEMKLKYSQMLKLMASIALKHKIGTVVDSNVIESNDIQSQVTFLKGSNKINRGDIISIRVWSDRMMICDTFYIGTNPIQLTKNVPFNISSVFFSFKAEEDEPKQKPQEVLPKFREKKNEPKEQNELDVYAQKRKESHRPAKPVFEEKQRKKVPICYSNQSEIPKKSTNKVDIDIRRFALLLPVGGALIPFHVAHIKNITTRSGFLRVNFNVPRDADEKIVYVKELSFHVRDPVRLERVEKGYKEMKRTWAEEEQLEDIRGIKEEHLVIRKENLPVLRAVCINPVLKGKKTEGALEAHMNGFRFVSNAGKVDIMYNNIRNAFFQNGERETVILFHFYLSPPVVMQNKRVSHIQFYNEIMDASLNIDRGDRYYSSADETREEQREMRIRAKYIHLYTDFMNKIKTLGVEIPFEIPFRELQFGGTIKRSTVTLQPTINCLINITDAPYRVFDLDTIDIVVFERLSRRLTLKNFDMVIIFKDHSKPVLQVSSVSKTDLDHIKKWLEKCDIKFYETQQSLNWSNVMQAINDDPETFKEKGWFFLDQDGQEQSESEEEGVEFDESLLEDEDDLSTSLSSEEESSEEEDEEDDDGESWSELEKEAMKEDAMKEREEQHLYGRAQMLRQRERVNQRKYTPQRTNTIQNFFKKTSSTTNIHRPQPVVNKAFTPSRKTNTSFSLTGGFKRPGTMPTDPRRRKP